jgi:3-methylfumaryl-CoA hydratase
MRHEIWQDGGKCLTEWRDLVYREDPKEAGTPQVPQARTDEDICEISSFDSTLLFRYSALTFNGHRIHYDIDYAKEIEGYTGLVVHGPLLAQRLMLLAERQLGTVRSFTFRATSPLMHFETAAFCWTDDGTAWVRGPDGRQNMIAKAG